MKNIYTVSVKDAQGVVHSYNITASNRANAESAAKLEAGLASDASDDYIMSSQIYGPRHVDAT